MTGDPRLAAIPDIHGHAKGEHKPFAEERPIPYTARMLFLWFFHACRRGSPRFMMVADHINYLTFEDPAAVNLVRRAFRLAKAGDLYGAAETAGVDREHARVVSEGLRRGMRFSIGAEVDNDPRSRPDAANIVDAMRPDGTIRSIHFLTITHPQHGEGWAWPFDNPEFAELYDVVGTERVWELYMKELLEAVATLPGNIVGHFYVPAKFGHWPADDVLETYEDQIVAAAGERGMALEINARYFYKYFAEDDAGRERFRAATLRLLRKAKAANVSVAVGSDAHSPKDQSNGFAEVLALLDEAEINEIAFPLDGRLAHVALRATEEMRKNAAARPFGGKQPDHVDEPDEDDAAGEVAAAPADAEPAKTVKTAASGDAAKRVRPARPSRSKAALAAVAAAKAAAGDAAGLAEPAADAGSGGAEAAEPAASPLEPEPEPAAAPPTQPSHAEPQAAEAAADAPAEPAAESSEAPAAATAPAYEPADERDPNVSDAEPAERPAREPAARPPAKAKAAPAKPPARSATTRGAESDVAAAKPRAKAASPKPAAAVKPASKPAAKAGASKTQAPAKPAARPAKAAPAAKAGAAKPQAAVPKGKAAATKSQPKPAAKPAAKAAAKPVAKAPASKAAAKPAASKAAAKSGAPKTAAAKPGAKKSPAKKSSGAKQR